MRYRIEPFICFVIAIAAVVIGLQPAARGQNATAKKPGTEADASSAYQAALKKGAPALHAFLREFPKGADLHVHLSGAVYAETFIRDAGEDGLCVDPAALSFAKPPCTPTGDGAGQHGRRTKCSTTGWSIHFPCAALCLLRVLAATISFSPPLTASAD